MLSDLKCLEQNINFRRYMYAHMYVYMYALSCLVDIQESK